MVEVNQRQPVWGEAKGSYHAGKQREEHSAGQPCWKRVRCLVPAAAQLR